MRYATLVLCTTLVVPGCSTTVTTVRTLSRDEYREGSWVGHTAEDVAVAWGENSGREPDGSGGKVLTYRRAATYYVTPASTSSAAPSIAGPMDKNDRAMAPQGGTADDVLAKFWVGSDGKVYRYWFAEEIYKKRLDTPGAIATALNRPAGVNVRFVDDDRTAGTAGARGRGA